MDIRILICVYFLDGGNINLLLVCICVFCLIEETTESGRTGGICAGLRGPAGWQYRHTNFVTGLIETWRISEACRVLEHRRSRSKLLALLPLMDYQPPEL